MIAGTTTAMIAITIASVIFHEMELSGGVVSHGAVGLGEGEEG
jgi:hypothetical protein